MSGLIIIMAMNWFHAIQETQGKVRRGAVAVLVAFVATGIVAPPGGAIGILPPAHPPANLPLTPGEDLVAATTDARALEGVDPLTLNQTAFDAMTHPQQVFVMTNLERTARGLPPAEALTSYLNAAAQIGADAEADPTIPMTPLPGGATVRAWGSVEISGSTDAVRANYLWMYDDGFGSNNIDCDSASDPGCWGHRDVLLMTYVEASNCTGGRAPVLVMGAAENPGVIPGGTMTGILVGACGATPTDEIFTWAHALELLGVQEHVVGMAPTASGDGYWIAENDGTVLAYGGAVDYGSMEGLPLASPIVGIAANPATGGYWLVAADGGIFSFNAPFFGSTGAIKLNQPIVAMTATPDGGGYWFVAADGGIFNYGNAAFYGSMGATVLNQPVVGMAADPATGGYWLVAADGGIFSFNAPFFGSTGAIKLNQPIVGMSVADGGSGYRFVAADGGIFSFGAPFYGSTGDIELNEPIVGMGANTSTGGYWMVALDGGIFSFNAPFHGSPA